MQRARNESSKDNRKQHILDCAEQIIISNGLDALSIARVAKESKLAVGICSKIKCFDQCV